MVRSLSNGVEASFVQSAIPSWVKLTDWQDLELVQPTDGVVYLLSDVQVNATTPSHTRFYRSVAKADSAAGLAGVADVTITFDPTWERVAFHHVVVWRHGTIVWRATIDDFQILQRERGMERRLYDGQLTADIVLHDVRVGDVVDWAYSIAGEHPTIGDRLSYGWQLSWSSACARTQCRLLTKDDRWLNFRLGNNTPEAILTHVDGLSDRIWSSRTEVPNVWERGAPAGFTKEKFVEITDTRNWHEVADLFRALYPDEGPLPSDLQLEVDKIVHAYSEDQDRQIMEALRLVQREVRYLALSMGTGGLTPRSSADIWASRFGDCKDKSRLLVSIFKSWNLDSCPALVNTTRCREIANSNPHVFAFDHCIVRLNVGGKVHYLDPTQLPQAGTLATRTKLDFGFALPLKEASNLEALPTIEAELVVEVQEVWKFAPKPNDPLTLVVKTQWRSWYADNGRNRLLQDGGERVAQAYEAFYDKRYSGAVRTQPTKFDDDPDANLFTIIEHYEIARPFTLPRSGTGLAEFHCIGEEVWPDFYLEEKSNRTAPYDLGLPRRKTRHATFELSFPTNIDGQVDEINSEGWSYKNTWNKINAKQIVIFEELHVRGGVILAENVPKFLEHQGKACEFNMFTYRLEAINGNIIVPLINLNTDVFRKFWWVWFSLFMFLLAAIINVLP